MRENKYFRGIIIFLSIFLLLLSLGIPDGFSAKVERDEAIAIADLWYAMEVNSDYVKIHKSEKAEMLKRVQNRQVLYLASKDELRETPPDKEEVLAYVVKYDPTGFVVVTADDRMEPIIVFDALSEFRWDSPERNFLRYFLGKEIPGRKECLEKKEAGGYRVEEHPSWQKLRSKLKQVLDLKDANFETLGGSDLPSGGSVYLLHVTPPWDQCLFYNETVLAIHNNAFNDIPTGCVATAMAIKMRFHEWPPTGSGGQHSYDDTEGTVRHNGHSVNYSNQTYNWSVMPMASLTALNADVEDLMYHCGVAVNMNYGQGCLNVGSGSSAFLPGVAAAMNDHFRYKRSTVEYFSHAEAAMRSIRGGLPVVMGDTVHAVVADGYRDDTPPLYFHINAGASGACNNWYNLTHFPNDPNSCSTGAIVVSIPYSSPENYYYVDGIWRPLPDGSILDPFEYVSQGVAAVPSGGHLWIKAGTYRKEKNLFGDYDVPITFTKSMTIRSYEGTATIGP